MVGEPDRGAPAGARGVDVRAPRVLVLSRSYPSRVLPNFGLWVARPVRLLAQTCDMEVVCPVPWCPPLPRLPQLATYTRFRDVPRSAVDEGVRVHHPRMAVGLGQSLYAVEDRTYELAVRATADRVWAEAPFDLIHASFSYPDGAVAHRLSQRYGVPFVVVEHAPWTPAWMRKRHVRSAAVGAARAADMVVPVSRATLASIVAFAGPDVRATVVPNGYDEAVFHPGGERDPDKVLFVGLLNFNKGLDVLFRAVQLLAESRPRIRLVVVGGAFYRDTAEQGVRLRAMVDALGLRNRVEFTGELPPRDVAAHMRSSALLVLPSHLESFGAVLVEALGCGTPVVATRCGGPEDIVTEEVGRLVPVGDAPALAAGIGAVLDTRWSHEAIRRYAAERFRWSEVADRLRGVYDDVTAVR